MTEFELVMILKETSNGIALDFEFFLAATFALIVVSYTVGERLSVTPRVIISGLYLAMVFLLFMRYQGQVSQAMYAAAMLMEMKSNYPILDMASLRWTRNVIFLGGTLAAIYALYKPVTASNDDK